VCRRNYWVAGGIYIRVRVSLDVASVYKWLIKGLACIYCNGQYDCTIEQELGIYCNGQYDCTIEQELGLNTGGKNTTSGPWTE
jgi:hypothetical protein